MTKAYECDRCRLTFIGEAKDQVDMPLAGSNFLLRFTFGLTRPVEEQDEIRAEADGHPLAKLIAPEDLEEGIMVKRADLCDPCRMALLKEAVTLSGLELLG